LPVEKPVERPVFLCAQGLLKRRPTVFTNDVFWFFQRFTNVFNAMIALLSRLRKASLKGNNDVA